MASTPSNPQPAPIAATQIRVEAQRRQFGAASVVYTPDLIYITDTFDGNPYEIVITGPTGKIDPSLISGGGGSTVSVNGVLVANPDFNDTTPAAPLGYTNVLWQHDGSGNVSAYYATSGIVAVPFNEITTGVNNTGQVLTVGSTSSLTYSGTGTINANEITGVAITNTPSGSGETLVSTSASTAQWQTAPSGTGNFLQVTVDFGFSSGNEGDIARTTVTGQTWVTSMSVILCNPFAGLTPDHSPDDAIVEGLVAFAENIVPGVGFDVVAYAPQNSWGRYLVNVVGQ